MSYCAVPWGHAGILTAGDQQGTRRRYPAPAPDFNGWQQIPGGARDISVGANGDVWVAGTDDAPDGHLYKLLPDGTWAMESFYSKRLAVGPNGDPWAINSAGQIYRREGGDWHLVPGEASDIAIGADGTVWIVGTVAAPAGGGYRLFRWNGSGWDAESLGRGALRVAVDRAGSPWIVDDASRIWRLNGGLASGSRAWVQVWGGGTDIAVSSSGTVWVAGAQGVAYRRDEYNDGWVATTYGSGLRDISVGPDGRVWGVNTLDAIFMEF
jgi:hypothetical protein